MPSVTSVGIWVRKDSNGKQYLSISINLGTKENPDYVQVTCFPNAKKINHNSADFWGKPMKKKKESSVPEVYSQENEYNGEETF